MSERASRPRRSVRSGLGRPMDFRLVSNRLSVALPLAAGAVAGLASLLTGSGFIDAIRSGVAAGGSSFLAWAVTRELDPDHPVAASLAAVVAPWAILSGPPSLAAVAVWLLAARIVAGTTGAAPYVADMFAVGAFAIWASTGEGGVPLALVALVAIASSTVFDARSRRTVLVGATLAAAACIATARVAGVLEGPLAWTSRSGWWVMAVVLTTATALLVRVESITDRRRVPIDTKRVRVAIGWAGAACVIAVVWLGPLGVASMAPMAAALALTAAFAVISRSRTPSRSRRPRGPGDRP